VQKEIYRVVIPDPLDYVVTGTKVSKKTGKVSEKRSYTSANVFFGGVHFKVREKIVTTCKTFLYPYLKDCPVLSDPPYSLVLQYCRKEPIDVDNKCYFWNKLIQDILAPGPTAKQNDLIASQIRLVRKLENDNSRYIDCLGWEYYCEEKHTMEILILKNV